MHWQASVAEWTGQCEMRKWRSPEQWPACSVSIALSLSLSLSVCVCAGCVPTAAEADRRSRSNAWLALCSHTTLRECRVVVRGRHCAGVRVHLWRHYHVTRRHVGGIRGTKRNRRTLWRAEIWRLGGHSQSAVFFDLGVYSHPVHVSLQAYAYTISLRCYRRRRLNCCGQNDVIVIPRVRELDHTGCRKFSESITITAITTCSHSYFCVTFLATGC